MDEGKYIYALESDLESLSKRSKEFLVDVKADVTMKLEPKQSPETYPLYSQYTTTRHLTNFSPKEEIKNEFCSNSFDMTETPLPETLRVFFKDQNSEYGNPFESLGNILAQLNDARGPNATNSLMGLTTDIKVETCADENIQISKKRKISTNDTNKEYPIKVYTNLKNEYILGPNGTKISGFEFKKVPWTTPQMATSKLLHTVFSDEELATHSLSGKPSPAFHNRHENIPKKGKLNPAIVEDIMVCVLNTVGGKKRHVRTTISSKCAEMSNKLKRRALINREKNE